MIRSAKDPIVERSFGKARAAQNFGSRHPDSHFPVSAVSNNGIDDPYKTSFGRNCCNVLPECDVLASPP